MVGYNWARLVHLFLLITSMPWHLEILSRCYVVNSAKSAGSIEIPLRRIFLFIVVDYFFFDVADIATSFHPKGKVRKFRSFFWKKTWHLSCVHSLGDLLLSLLLKWLQKLAIVYWEEKLDIILDIQGTFLQGIPDVVA